jgi:hypothetical protein
VRKFALSIAAVLVLAAPAAAEARDGGMLTNREVRSAVRAYVTTQVEALQQFRGLTVTASRVSAPVDRVGPRRVTVPVAFALRWDDGRSFVCLNRVHVSKHGRSIRSQPGNFDC